MEPYPLIGYTQNCSKPTNTKVFRAALDGIDTDFIIVYFKNNITCLILQSEAVGNLYSVKIEETHRDDLSDPGYNLVPLQGVDNIEIEAAIRYIVGQLNIKKHMVFGLNLKDYKVDTLKLIVDVFRIYNVSFE